VTGDQLYELLSGLIFWGLFTLAFCVLVVAIAYFRGRRKL
jgi:hypothetical protein